MGGVFEVAESRRIICHLRCFRQAEVCDDLLFQLIKLRCLGFDTRYNDHFDRTIAPGEGMLTRVSNTALTQRAKFNKGFQ